MFMDGLLKTALTPPRSDRWSTAIVGAALLCSLLLHWLLILWTDQRLAFGGVSEPTDRQIRLTLQIDAAGRALQGQSIPITWQVVPRRHASALQDGRLVLGLQQPDVDHAMPADPADQAGPAVSITNQAGAVILKQLQLDVFDDLQAQSRLMVHLPSDIEPGTWELVAELRVSVSGREIRGASQLSSGDVPITLTARRPIQIQPNAVDLAVESLDLLPAHRNDDAAPADTIVTRLRVRNLGGRQPDRPWIDRLFLSATPTLSPTARMLGHWSWKPNPDGGERYEAVLSWQALLHAPDFPSPTAWIIAVVDADDRLGDPVRSNNIKAIEINWEQWLQAGRSSSLPNLVANPIEAPGQVRLDDRLPVVISWANTGSATAIPPWHDQILLIPAGDEPVVQPQSHPDAVTLHTAQRNSTLGPDEGDAQTLSLRLPDELKPGRYELIYIVNRDQEVIETRWDDNIARHTIEILQAPDPIALGRDQPTDHTSVAWLNWDDFLTHLAPQSETLQPALENRPAAQSVAQQVQPTRALTADRRPSEPQGRPGRAAPQPSPMKHGQALPPIQQGAFPDSPERGEQALTALGRPEGRTNPFETGRQSTESQPATSPEDEPVKDSSDETPGSGQEAHDSADTEVAQADPSEQAPQPPAEPRQGDEQPPSEERSTTPRQSPNSDSRADPTMLEELRHQVRPGQVVSEEGIRIITRHFDLPLSILLMNLPRNPVVRIQFNTEGRVIRHELIQSSGVAELDSAVISGLYRWEATGEKLKELDRPFWRQFTILLIPRR